MSCPAAIERLTARDSVGLVRWFQRGVIMIFRTSVSALALCLLAACSQGSDIASPGPSNPGTPPGGGGGGDTVGI